jgi:hypothetical protein
MLRAWLLTLVFVVVASAARASAAPGDSFGTERTRLVHDGSIAPLQSQNASLTQWRTHDRAQDPQNPGTFSWTFGFTLRDGAVASETIDVRSLDRPYAMRTDGTTLLSRVAGRAVLVDFAAAAVIARQSNDPAIRQEFLRGSRYAYRTVDDERTRLHLLEIMPRTALANEIAAYDATYVFGRGTLSKAAASRGDALFAVNAFGALEPVAVRVGNGYANAPSSNEAPDTALAEKARAALVEANDRIHLVFGRQTVATLPVVDDGGNGGIVVPPTVPLGGRVFALASPTLGGSSALSRRGPDPNDRSAVLALAARRIGARTSQCRFVALTELDLGRGPAIVGSVIVAGTNEPRVDRHLFFVAELRNGTYELTLAVADRVVVTDPNLAETGEALIDAVDLRNGATILVSRVTNAEAHTFVIYARTADGWRQAYTGGGSAN